jgi:membrane protein involved in colicin uptake
LEYTDPEAKKDREEKAAKEAKKKQEADAKAAAEAERKAQESVVINAENNEEFAQVLAVAGPGDPLVADFASKCTMGK